MSIFDKYRPQYTYTDFLKWEGEGNWELIDGMPYAKSSSPRLHQQILGNLLSLFNDVLNNNGLIKYEALFSIGWKIEEKTLVIPDILVFRKSSEYKDFLDYAPSLALEILAPSTLHIDRNEKFELYEQEGVKYYLIVDPQFNKIEVYQLIEGKYQPVAITPPQFTFLLEEGCELPVDFTATWD